MESTLHDCDLKHKVDLERLDRILERLPDTERAGVWRGIALNLAERCGEGKS